MKGFNDSRFFNLWSRLLSATDPSGRRHRWTVAGVEWHRDRHAFRGRDHAFQHEVHRLTCTGGANWSLMVVTEFWWDETRKSAIRSQRWARLTGGRKADAVAWFREQERLLPQ